MIFRVKQKKNNMQPHLKRPLWMESFWNFENNNWIFSELINPIKFYIYCYTDLDALRREEDAMFDTVHAHKTHLFDII